MFVRALLFLLALPALAVGAIALGSALAPEQAVVQAGVRVLASVVERAGANSDGLSSVLALGPGAGATGLGLLLLALALRGRRKAKVAEDSPSGLIPQMAAQTREPQGPDKRTGRRILRQARALAKQGDPLAAAEICVEAGLLDAAADWFEQADEWVRAAEIRHDQNRFAEAAELYVKAGLPDKAGTIYAAHDDHAHAAACYEQAGRMSVAGEMYEKAGDLRRAGICYRKCEFHRQAGDAFAEAQDWANAAQSFEQVLVEEGGRTTGQDPARDRARAELVKRAGSLYERGSDHEAALRVYERGESWAAAGEIALRLERIAEAAEFFKRAGDAPRAADALRRIGEDKEAAQVLGEHYRDQGDAEQAAQLLAEAEDFAAAGDIYRTLDDHKMAAECYERLGDPQQAAEMFALAGEHARASAAYEQLREFALAAECAAQAGDVAREAELLARAGRPIEAAEHFVREGLEEEAISVLQQVTAGPDLPAAAALLGRIFLRREKPALALAKLESAAAAAEIGTCGVELFYLLGLAREAAGQPREALQAYEQVLSADYQYEDVEARLESLRAQQRDQTAPGAATQPGPDPGESRPARYHITGELGRGGMGIVYKAEDTVLDRSVAFKVLPDALRDSPEALKNFLREAKSAAKLNHPNIVTVYDAGEQDGRFYIAMEYVDGTTLKEIVRRKGAIAPRGVLHVALQMCDALDFAHRNKIVHRDVKTANTMWTRDRQAKIMDFGLAKVVEEVRNHTTLVSGTPYYMSPEQTLGRNVDHRTDIYSLGVTLFELATGVLPFREGNVPYHHVHTPAPNPLEVNPKLPKGLAQVIYKCMKKDPDQRFQTAGEIGAIIRPALADATRRSQ